MSNPIVLFMLLSTLAAQTPEVKVSAGVPAPVARTLKTLDNGQLQNAWFGVDLEWKEHPKGFLDYFWMKPGLNLKGRAIHLKKWESPAMLIPGREASSYEMAVKLGDIARGDMEARFEHLLDDKVKVGFYDGDVEMIGRVADCRYIPTTLGLFGTDLNHTTCSATFDMKLIDAKTGEVLVAVHHRMASTNHDLDMMMHHWVPDFGRYLGKVAVH